MYNLRRYPRMSLNFSQIEARSGVLIIQGKSDFHLEIKCKMVKQSWRKKVSSKNSISFKFGNFSFDKQSLKNRISFSVSPKLENLVPLETTSKVLKVPRRHYSMIPNWRHSNFSFKFLIWTPKTALELVFGKFWKFGKIREMWSSLSNLKLN